MKCSHSYLKEEDVFAMEEDIFERLTGDLDDLLISNFLTSVRPV